MTQQEKNLYEMTISQFAREEKTMYDSMIRCQSIASENLQTEEVYNEII